MTSIKTAKQNMEAMQTQVNKHRVANNSIISKGRGSTTINQQKQVQEDETEKKLSLVIKVLLWLVIFLLPTFFIPNNPSVLELNKQVLLVGLVGIAFLAWVGSMAIKSRIKFRANFIFIPVFIFLIIMGVSTVLADYTSQSMWGFFGGEARSYVSLVFFVAFFVLFINNVKSRKDITITLTIMLVSGFITSVYGLLQLWGKYILPIPGTNSPFFNTVGSVYLFGVYLSALFMLALTIFLYSEKVITKAIVGVLALFFFIGLSIVGLKIIWIALVISLALILGRMTIGGNKEPSSSFKSVLVMVFLVLSLLMILQKQPIIKKQLPVEVLLTYKSSASIAWSAVKHDFLLGSGPSNYINVYRQFRPLNLGNFWATNFNTSASYFLTLVSTTGILGAFSFLALIIMATIYLFKGILSSDDKVAMLGVGIGSIWVLLSLMLLLYVANMTVLFMWWVALSLLVSILAFSPKTELREFSTGSDDNKPSLLFSFIFVLIIIGVVVALYVQGQKYIAAVYFNKALIADTKGEDIGTVINGIDKAVTLDINKDLYYRNRSLAYFAMANKKIAERGKDFNPDDAAYVSESIKRALNDANKAQILNPYDVDNYMSLVRIYESLLPTMEGAGEQALEHINKAIEFDPNNPALYYQAASIYISMADLEIIKGRAKKEKELSDKAKEYLASAKNKANKAIELKPNLLVAKLLLVGIYDREDNKDETINAMISARKTFPSDPKLAFQLGWFYWRDDKIDEAGNQFAQAVGLDNKYANAHYFLGLVLDKKGRKDYAIKEFEKVLELNKGNKLVESILENLKAGREALAGLRGNNNENQKQEVVNDKEEQPTAQPSINPEIDKNQTIPRAATQNIESDNRQDNNSNGDANSDGNINTDVNTNTDSNINTNTNTNTDADTDTGTDTSNNNNNTDAN
jgi:tetratricopeptide (TPR) repeat protein